jgi:hypothetical protein
VSTQKKHLKERQDVLTLGKAANTLESVQYYGCVDWKVEKRERERKVKVCVCVQERQSVYCLSQQCGQCRD